jgi:hypothetical protein
MNMHVNLHPLPERITWTKCFVVVFGFLLDNSRHLPRTGRRHAMPPPQLGRTPVGAGER